MASGSPLIIFSAPTFFPLEGQPYLGLKTLFQTLQELRLLISTIRRAMLIIFLMAD